MKVPGAWCLNKVEQKIPTAEKCSHEPNHGQWLVEWNGELYAIQPSNGLQKDFWLSSAKKRVGDKAEKALRWLCHDCGTVQMP